MSFFCLRFIETGSNRSTEIKYICRFAAHMGWKSAWSDPLSEGRLYYAANFCPYLERLRVTLTA